ncbi:hypothetical protein Vretimale_17590 [Volvox reticuliferus]|uniref:Uncharacterized protein n=1 Tax=Volvox reticuliferus TaxID=1737510 RepID=A0A8J4LYL7_9CHLO|nr:hypothetical protein Vretifemale_3552 [Volvox reticuliferus]GIM14781.1 hypothetical protein Vretimale_17590 [Volvox reticuliferus]
MADIISDDRLRREARELLDGKAKTLLDNNQLTMRIMRKLLEEKLGLAEGSLEAKKKAICAFVKEALALEPNTTAAAKAQSPKGAATASGAAVPGGSTGSHKENQKPSGASNITDSDRKAAKSGGKARQADADAPSGGAAQGVGSTKGRARDVEKVQRRNGKKRTAVSDSVRESSDGDSGQERDEEEAGKSQKKRAKKTRHGSSGPVSGEGANVAKGKVVTSRAIEMMKEVCKKATIKIGPTLYVRNKTVSELENALSELLARHGLDAHSHDKQIGQVRRHLERNRDLEGIDTSNIISEGSGRPRRAAASSINFRQMFKQPKVDSEDEEDSEEEEQDEGNDRSARKKRLTDHKASKIKAKRNVDDDKDNEEQEQANSHSGSESEAGEDDGEVDEAEEQERARVPARPGKAIAATTRAKEKHQASAKQQRSGRRKEVDGSDEGSGDGDDEPSESSEDLVNVTHGLKKGGGAARAGRGGAKANEKASEKGRPHQHGSVGCESVEEGLEDSDVEPQPAKKIVTAKTKARRVVDEDDKEEEEEGSTRVTEEEEEVEDEVDADDSDFELVDDDDD